MAQTPLYSDNKIIKQFYYLNSYKLRIILMPIGIFWGSILCTPSRPDCLAFCFVVLFYLSWVFIIKL